MDYVVVRSAKTWLDFGTILKIESIEYVIDLIQSEREREQSKIISEL